MKKSYCVLLALTLLALSPMPGETAAKPESFRYQYSSDSDGVKARSIKISDEDSGEPLTHSVYYTQLSQTNRPSITEKTVVFKWVRPLQNQGYLTLWAGYMKNDIRHFIPAAIMYNKEISDTQNVWISAGRETVGTIAANEQGINRTSVSASYQWKTGPASAFTVSGDHWFYTDDNREEKWQALYTHQLSSRLDVTAAYTYHTASTTHPGVYWVPQQEHTFSLAPRYTIPIGAGNLSLTLKKSLWARNTDGSIKQHEIKGTYQLGRFSASYSYLRDGDYTSRLYSADYQFFF